MNMIRRDQSHTALRLAGRLLAGAAVVMALSLKPLLLAAMPSNPEAAARAKYDCPKAAGDADKARVAATLSVKTSDKNALACAADLRSAVALASPSDLNAHVAALESLSNYIELVHTLKLYDLVRVNWAEYDLRLGHANTLASALLPPTRQAWPNEPAIMILTAEVESSLAGPSDPQVTNAAIAAAKKAIELDPKALQGEGQFLIGRRYLELPPLFGGDTQQGVTYMERAREISPGDPRTLRFLAEAYDELGKHDAAMQSLRALAEVAPRSTNFQMYADEWRTGEGLATRMGDAALADRFAARRADLMHQHPNLLLHKVQAVFGHGGDDPMTGTPQYRGELTNTH